MNYFNGIKTFTELLEKRTKLLQNSPEDTQRINSEFMQAKDALIKKHDAGDNQAQKRPRIAYKVELTQEAEPGVKLIGNCIYVSIPAYQAYNAEYMSGQIEFPKVVTPATMALFIPPLTPAPFFCFT